MVNAIFDRYNFFLETGGNEIQVYPHNNSEEFIIEISQDSNGFRRKLWGQDLKFQDDKKNSHLDYTLVNDIEQDCNLRCTDTAFRIAIFGTNDNIHRGFLNFDGITNNESKGRIEIPIVDNDDYQCLVENYKKKINIILEVQTKYSVKSLLGEVQTEECFQDIDIGTNNPQFPTESTNCLYDPAKKWVVKSNDMEINPVGGGTVYNIRTFWVRETISYACPGPPPGYGWDTLDQFTNDNQFPSNSCVGNGQETWVRELPLVYDVENSFRTNAPPPPPDVLERWFIQNIIIPETYPVFDNAMKLGDVLSELLSDCNYTIISHLFGISEALDITFTPPANDAYTFGADFLQNIFIWQLSDITNAASSNNATRAEVSFEDVINDMIEMFFLEVRVLNGNQVYIEHVSFWESNDIASLDLTLPEYAANMSGRRKYNYDKVESYKYETFDWPIKTKNELFEAKQIVYNNSCVKEGTDKPHKVKTINTDIGTFLTTQVEQTKGLFMAATDNVGTTYAIQSAPSALDNAIVVLNGNLSWPNLHANLGRWKRQFKQGLLNDQATTFESIIRTKIQKDLTIKMPRQDFFNFDINKLVTTTYGDGEIKTGSYNLLTEKLTLEVVFEKPNC